MTIVKPPRPIVNRQHPLGATLACALVPWARWEHPDDLLGTLGAPSSGGTGPTREVGKYGVHTLYDSTTGHDDTYSGVAGPMEDLKASRSFTIWARLRFDDLNVASEIFGDSSASNSWAFGHNSGANPTWVWYGVAALTWWSTTLTDGWHDIAIVVRSSSLDFYIDGEFQETASNSSTPGASTAGWIFGTQGIGWHHWNGALAGLFVFSKELTSSEIAWCGSEIWNLIRPQEAPAAVGGDENITQTAVVSLALAALAGEVTADQAIEQASDQALFELTAFSGEVNAQQQVEQQAQVALDLTALAGSVTADQTIEQVAQVSLDLVAYAGVVSLDQELVQTSLVELVLVTYPGNVASGNALVQTAQVQLALTAYAGVVTDGLQAKIVQLEARYPSTSVSLDATKGADSATLDARKVADSKSLEGRADQ